MASMMAGVIVSPSIMSVAAMAIYLPYVSEAHIFAVACGHGTLHTQPRCRLDLEGMQPAAEYVHANNI